MSNEEYTHQNYWAESNICIEKNKEGKCLVSARYVFLDFKDIEIKPQPFCYQIKINNHDKTV